MRNDYNKQVHEEAIEENLRFNDRQRYYDRLNKRGFARNLTSTLVAIPAIAITSIVGVGCGSTKTVSEVDGLRSQRRIKTVEGFTKYSERLKQMEEKATNDYADYVESEEAKDLKILDDAEKEKKKLVELRDSFYNSLRGLKGLPTKEETSTPKERNLQLYGLSQERDDINTYHFGGIGFRREAKKGKIVYSLGGEIASAEKTVRTPILQKDYSSNAQTLYGGAAIKVLNLGPFELDLGLKGMFRWQEDVINTADSLGNSTWKDTTSIPGVGIEATGKIGRFFIRAGHEWNFGGKGSHENLETTTIQGGLTF